MIRDINSQIERAINEIEKRDSKDLIFTIHGLLVTQSYEGTSNFSAYKNILQAKLNSGRVAQPYCTRNGKSTYIKLKGEKNWIYLKK